MVASLLILEHLITLLSPVWERWLFMGRDRAEIELLQVLEERLLTVGDLHQFLESILAAVCDRLQASGGFVAALGAQGLDLLVTIGGDKTPEENDLSNSMLTEIAQNGSTQELYSWGNYWLVPLFEQDKDGNKLLGLLGVYHQFDQTPENDQLEDLSILSNRAALALSDRYKQQQVFTSLEELTPQMDLIQRLRAAARYDGTEILTTPDFSFEQKNLSQLVKDALSHYWGGPKLTDSPLLNLKVVKHAQREYDENPTNALRSILRKGIDQVRPEGDRRFTGEWILYNILEMKFMEGRKVREIAMRLAMSEADLYRKQRVAIEAVAKAIVEMEHEVSQEESLTNEVEVEGI
jgi:hypothetical protein